MNAAGIWGIIGLVVVAACCLGVLALIVRSIRLGIAYLSFSWIINFEPSRYDHPRILDPRYKVERSKSPIDFWFCIVGYLFFTGALTLGCAMSLLTSMR